MQPLALLLCWVAAFCNAENSCPEVKVLGIGDSADKLTVLRGCPGAAGPPGPKGDPGEKGDSLGYHNDRPFTTKDQDNDIYNLNCATSFKGAWWYGSCHNANLNGLYLRGSHTSYADGIIWETGKGDYYSYKITEMKFRPV